MSTAVQSCCVERACRRYRTFNAIYFVLPGRNTGCHRNAVSEQRLHSDAVPNSSPSFTGGSSHPMICISNKYKPPSSQDCSSRVGASFFLRDSAAPMHPGLLKLTVGLLLFSYTSSVFSLISVSDYGLVYLISITIIPVVRRGVRTRAGQPP